MEIKVRPSVISDAEAIAELERLCFEHPWSEDSVKSELAGERGRFFTAECDGKVCGYIGCAFVVGEYEIYNVATHPDFRKQGVGSKLLEALIDSAKLEAVSAISLEVRPSNAPALALYGKYGFKEEGRRKNYYGNEDAILLWKRDI